MVNCIVSPLPVATVYPYNDALALNWYTKLSKLFAIDVEAYSSVKVVVTMTDDEKSFCPEPVRIANDDDSIDDEYELVKKYVNGIFVPELYDSVAWDAVGIKL